MTLARFVHLDSPCPSILERSFSFQFCPVASARAARSPERRGDGRQVRQRLCVLSGVQGGGHPGQDGAQDAPVREARHGRGVQVRGLQLPDSEQTSVYEARLRQDGPKDAQGTSLTQYYNTLDFACTTSAITVSPRNIYQFQCEHCDKEFRSRVGLDLHTKLHIGGEGVHRVRRKVNWFKSQSVNTYFSVHVMRSHTLKSSMRFKCSECPYASVEKAALDKHVRIKHTNERPFVCAVCGFRDVIK